MVAALADVRRRAGLTALYLGIFATVWLSVPAAEPPLGVLLVVASIAALITAVAGGVLVFRARADGPVLRDAAADRRYLVIFAAELATAGFGAMLLAVTHRSEYIPVLVGAIVGVHFWPLAPVLKDPALRVLAVLVVLAALTGLITGLVSTIPAGQVVGAGIGVLLLGYGLGALIRGALTWRVSPA
ncbi:hypothetical protein [Actinoplanes couchii]|uniref:Uncharacterized protein n=1 Tax=Actinoplanes couchii TaxID=403638 RepID=A0ABQ3XIA0_9ACTN|nr:hypothetical protein [Actinoplanes couchii]MDR6324655.1 hypothetical protein [Actinoplanes couchii]GID58208.1 hypothetical protein Aco03nite_066120 [Actinoplanes couchii]